MGQVNQSDVEQVSKGLIESGAAFEVKYDGSEETLYACRLAMVATEIVKRNEAERELCLTNHALAEQAEQTGELLTTIVRNATSQQQLRVTDLEMRNAELEQRIASAIELLELGPEGECGGADTNTVIERAHAVLCGEPDPYDVDDGGDPTDTSGSPKLYQQADDKLAKINGGGNV